MSTRRTTGGSAKGQYSFAQIPSVQTQRSVFNRSSGLTTTLDAGLIVPIFVDEVLPGDTMTMRVNSFARLATPIVPVMDNLYLDMHWFFVSNRLLWDDWQHFMGEKDNPDDDFTYTLPKVTIQFSESVSNSIFDYFGIPIDDTISVNALPFRAYNLIIKEWFRDQSLSDSPAINKGPGPDQGADYSLKRRAKRHDYFTAALPFAQRGPVVDVPILGEAPVTGDISSTGLPWNFRNSAGTEVHDVGMINDAGVGHYTSSNNQAGVNLQYGSGLIFENGIANLDDVQAISVNALRQSVQLQRMFERDARAGVRYTEILAAHFRVQSPDARLQRPEFLGYASSRITFHPVAQTNATNNTTPKGDLSAFATASIDGRGFSQSFTEHGYIIGLASVRADQTYQYGLERMWSRETKYDFYWPALAHLGEQEILNKELWYYNNDGLNDEVWGYQERWAEYRYKPSKITGQVRSYVTGGDPLHYWHLAQEWNNRPLLNEEFIEERPPMERVLAVPSEPDIFLDVAFNYRSTRVMPTFSVPGLMDHF